MGWIKFTNLTNSSDVTEMSWSMERIARIFVADSTTVKIYFDEPAFNNRSVTSGYIKITTPANQSDEFHSELINYIVQASRHNTLDPLVTINTSVVTTIEFVGPL